MDNCIICNTPFRKAGKKYHRHKHNKDVGCMIAHKTCIVIIKEFRNGNYRAYMARLSANGLLNNYGLPIGNFPCPILTHDVIRKKIKSAERRNKEWGL